MKKIFLAFAFLLILFPLFSENLQIVMPKIIYVGDTVEIRYVFKSKEDFGLPQKNGLLNLKKNSDFLRQHAPDFTVTSGFLQKNGEDCTLCLSLIPWKSGFLKIPRFNLSYFIQNCRTDDFSSSDKNLIYGQFDGHARNIIEISQIEVKSLLENNEKNDFFPQKSPLVLPGTTALLVTLGILAFIAFSALIYVILHLPKVSHFVTNLLYIYSLKKNTRKTLKKLLGLKKDSPQLPSDKDFAARLQHILRDFLTGRFKKEFSSVTTRNIYQILEDLCGGSFLPNQEITVEKLISIFSRLDFIRYSEKNVFLADEREKLVSLAIEQIENFEAEEEN
jgi:hypothetical protein